MITGIRLQKAIQKCFLLLLCLCPATYAQIADERAHEIAKETVRSARGNDAFFCAHRREDLEDSFYSVLSNTRNAFKRDPRIFEVSEEGYEFRNDGVRYHFNLHATRSYFVAVATQTGEVFRIGGFNDAQQEFNRLARTYQVRLQNEPQAEDYVSLYLLVDPLSYHLERTQFLFALKQLAERRFDGNNDDFEFREEKFDQWWHKNEAVAKRLSLKQETRATEEGFDVTFITVSDMDRNAPKDGPALLRVTLKLSKGGEVEKPAFAPLDPR